MQTDRELESVEDTGKEMHRLAFAFREDVLSYAHMSLDEFFSFVAVIPYVNDPDSVEFLQRPYYTLTGTGQGGDCDDKAIVMAAYAILHEIPYQFVAVAKEEGDDLHHVFTELQINGAWVPFDVTYAFNTLGQPVNYSKRMIL